MTLNVSQWFETVNAVDYHKSVSLADEAKTLLEDVSLYKVIPFSEHSDLELIVQDGFQSVILNNMTWRKALVLESINDKTRQRWFALFSILTLNSWQKVSWFVWRCLLRQQGVVFLLQVIELLVDVLVLLSNLFKHLREGVLLFQVLLHQQIHGVLVFIIFLLETDVFNFVARLFNASLYPWHNIWDHVFEIDFDEKKHVFHNNDDDYELKGDIGIKIVSARIFVVKLWMGKEDVQEFHIVNNLGCKGRSKPK